MATNRRDNTTSGMKSGLSAWRGASRRAAFLAMEQWIRTASLVGDSKFFAPERFPWVAPLEANHGLMRAELDRLLVHHTALPNFQDVSPAQEHITRDDLWKTYFFYFYGRRVRANCKRCPETDRLLRTIPGMRTAFFSILMPGKEIPVHRGPYNGVLRYHLGLKIPQPEHSCGIVVGGERANWSTGKSLIFDDTYLHRAWNLSKELRAILFVDFCRPLPLAASVLNRLYIAYISTTPFIRTLLARQRDWTATLDAVYRDHD
jgi:aspartyl/asparaginyl beta-hydroxylase (cupin superfamily)